MGNFRTITSSLLLTASAFAALAGQDLRVEHLGTSNTLLRVNPDSARYLLMPVQESNDDARINVLVDGRPAETIFVRLSSSRTDYSVPFDLTPYKGHDVIFDIVTPQGRSSVREASEDVCWSGFRLSDTFDTTDREQQYRPAYHHTPLYGWMNDPNGMFYKDGVWHLYYQFNPYGSKWQNMTWGHSTSRDLIHWNHEPVAIRPDGLGSIFSGSCVVDRDNTAGFGRDAVIALYTSAGTSQMQSLAASRDGGMSFEKLPSNPVLTLDSEARDPNMFWNEATGEWNLTLAHALEHEMLFFTSPDLKTWTLSGAFGKGLGAQDGVWECPDLFRLPVEGENGEKWVLLCNINPGGPFGGSATQYFIGDWDGRTFTADTDASGAVPTKWLDYGKDHYATVSWSGTDPSRRTVIGWMSNWQYAADVPTMQFRSANTLPREMGLFRGADGELYVSSAPSPELAALRGTPVVAKGTVKLGASPRTFRLPADGLCEIVMNLDASRADCVVAVLSNAEGERCELVYDPREHTLSFDRRQSGLTDFSDAFPAVTVAPTHEADGSIQLRVFIDRSSVEVFADGGKAVMTNLVFPTAPYTSLSLSASGAAKATDLRIFPISE